MENLLTTALGMTLGVAGASAALAESQATELTVAIVNNCHMHQHAKSR